MDVYTPGRGTAMGEGQQRVCLTRPAVLSHQQECSPVLKEAAQPLAASTLSPTWEMTHAQGCSLQFISQKIGQCPSIGT